MSVNISDESTCMSETTHRRMVSFSFSFSLSESTCTLSQDTDITAIIRMKTESYNPLLHIFLKLLTIILTDRYVYLVVENYPVALHNSNLV